jgi:hypothetical protein
MNKEELKNKGIDARLAYIRAEIMNKGLTPTGELPFGGSNKAKYWKASDYMPTAIQLNQEAGVSYRFGYDIEKATYYLTMINTDNPEDRFESYAQPPENASNFKSAIQGQGAVRSYMFRYLTKDMYGIPDPTDLIDEGGTTKPKKYFTDEEIKNKQEKFRAHFEKQFDKEQLPSAYAYVLSQAGVMEVSELDFNEKVDGKPLSTVLLNAIEDYKKELKKPKEEELDV